jgi:hypothetical protein
MLAMPFYTETQLSPRQSLLPSGALLCHGVKLARTGQQFYHVSEIPFAAGDATPDGNGMIRVWRGADQVFNARSMASFEGAPLTMRHPDGGGVDPANWSALSVGHAQNIRRDGDFLVGDLVVHDQRAIAAIRHGGWRGISAGYDCDYSTDGNGGLVQGSIKANHIALLGPDDEARCGAACSIGDAAYRDQRGPAELVWGRPVKGYRPPVIDRQLAAINQANRQTWGLEG